ncbi:homogentisate 1,2-dioxygenase [Lasiosphaeria miniovina]|uniref:homogentisate 1,2-dioxygenase n=1 Tax=Lasiosphaeria miniovina TaxID=1954250 RepID=A0AA40A502_9PEZI|nr:homogentisate 1,2-dioxygenase [Lasiosphaeria miniovina]KAK0709290.1 homogentisate 1,2-dioxygenase [Lasiosphaeria miniovina]
MTTTRTFTGATAPGPYTTPPTAADPYTYQVGFGNRFASEALPGALPVGCNTPQRCAYDLVSEQLNGAAFVSPRASQLNSWLYRIQPSLAHAPPRPLLPAAADIEAVFTSANPAAVATPQDYGWDKFPLPSASEGHVDFVAGLKTVAGHGDATLGRGLALHVYAANASMGPRRAFCNNDGDMLLLPQEGRLDVQTEFGRLMARPGELVVVQAGIRFSVRLPDGVGRGYAWEVFGGHFELPELGPVGANGMAQARDFETPVAGFDVDLASGWTVVVKLAGRLIEYEQPHTPFDVVAWHGNYAPYKYALERFVSSATSDRDQSDPSICCVVTARCGDGVVADLLVFTPKTLATRDTFRPPYFHRNMATELMGMVYGVWHGSGTRLEPGGLTYEPSYMPHGESHQRWIDATTADLGPERIFEDTIAFMIHVSAHVSLTKYALERSGCLQPVQDDVWRDVEPAFVRHLGALGGEPAAEP